jgi:hypothetical protein
MNLEAFNLERVDKTSLLNNFNRINGNMQANLKKSGLDEHDFGFQFQEMVWHYARADLLATSYKKRHYLVSTMIYILAPVAILAIALHSLLFANLKLLIIVELIAMASILLIMLISWISGWQRKWLDYRHMAERLQALIFLKISGHDWDLPKPPPFLGLDCRYDDWMVMALNWIWDNLQIASADYSEKLKEFIKLAWIQDQANYYQRNGSLLRAKHIGFAWISIITFSITFIAALLHLLPFMHAYTNYLSLIAIFMPAFGAAAAGLKVNREFERNSRRYLQMAQSIGYIAEELECTIGHKAFLKLIKSMDEMTFFEHQDWRVSSGHRLDPPV